MNLLARQSTTTMTKRYCTVLGVPESSDSCPSSSSSRASAATTPGSVCSDCSSKRPRTLQCYRNDYQRMAKFKQWVAPSSKGKYYARCKLCCSDLNISQGGKSDLMKHKQGKKHKEYKLAVNSSQSVLTFATQLPRREEARAALLMAYFLVEHNLPIVLADHIPQLNLAQYPDSAIASRLKCARTKTTALVNKVLAAETHREVIESMQACKFSLIMDETTDITVVKQACLLARLFDPVTNRIQTFFYKIVEVPNADAGNLFNAVKSNFASDSISFTNHESVLVQMEHQ